MSTVDLSTRPLPARGGLNATVLGIELKRVLRNRRTMVFTLVFPVVMFLLVSSSIPKGDQSMGPGVLADVGAYIAVSMALYGSAMAATSGGASVSVERASGWSRQLRLTPLSPVAYVAMKVVTAVLLGLVALVAAFTVADLSGKAHMAAATWLEAGAVIVLGSLVFAAFGLFAGYLVPSDNVMQVLGPMMAVLGFLGGLFQGPVDTSSVIGRIQSFTPVYGLSQLAHWPLTRTVDGAYDTFSWWWVVNLVVWGVLFAAGAVWRFRRDTARV